MTLNPNQFRETMLARDLVNIPSLKHQGEWKDTPYKDLPGSLDFHVEDSKSEVSLEPAEENLGYDNLYDYIKDKGVLAPVQVRRDGDSMTLMDGHHRVAVAHHLNPDMEVPVRFE
jgi:hypothetical protein